MKEEEFIKNCMKGICLEDSRVSLEAKGLYYTALNNAYNNDKSIYDLFNKINEDKDFIMQLVEELIRYGYFKFGVLLSENNFFIFETETC